VMSAIGQAMEELEVLELAPDPPGWVIEVEEWEQTYGEVVVRFDTNQPARMGPACDDFEQAVRDGRLTHDGSEILHRHVGNCIAVNRRGQVVVTKSAPDSPDKIDAAVAAIVAHHRAMWRFTHPTVVEEDLGALLIDTRGEQIEGTCPACHMDGQLRTAGRRIRCGSCGHSWVPEEATE
jgi:phage terminase large subunit-like protein